MVTFKVFTTAENGVLANSTAPISADLTPVSIETFPVSASELQERMPYLALIAEPDKSTRCFYLPLEMKKTCLSRGSFSTFPKIRMAINFEKFKNNFQLSSWFIGRSEDARISYLDGGRNNSRLILEGKPVTLNSARVDIPWSLENYKLGRELHNRVWDILGDKQPELRVDSSDISCYRLPSEPWNYDRCSPFGNPFVNMAYSAEDAFAHFLWREVERYFSIMPDEELTVWNFKKANPLGEAYVKMQRCSLQDRPSGLIASNATSLLPAAPQWDESDSSLKYSLASTHTDLKGEVVVGFYRLTLAEGVARCLWGGDINGAEARVEIIASDTGRIVNIVTSKIASQEGYVQFDASGFNYSAKEIKVNLSLAKPTKKELPTTSLEPASEPAPKILVRCKKGNSTKKFKTLNGKCPKGFSKVK